MAKKRSKERSSRSRGGGGGSWKKSKSVMYGLVGVIVIVWGFLLLPRLGGCGRDKPPAIPQAFICSECGEISVYDEHPGGMPPYECKKCGEEAAWDAYVCNNEKCIDEDSGEPIVFPHIIELPEGVEPPEEGEEPSPEYMEAMMNIEMDMPKCPKCGESMPNVERYMTEEAKQMLEELREKYQKKRGK